MRWLVLLALIGCGARPSAVSRPVARGIGGDAHQQALDQAERHFAARADEAELRKAIAAWKRAVELKDDDVAAYAMLARSRYLLADGFLGIDPARKDEMIAVFEECHQAADRGLRALSPSYEKVRRAGGEADQAALGLGKEAAPLLYWYAHCVIRWGDAKGRMTVMGVYQRVFRIMEMVRELDEGYDHAGAARFFGAARAEAPAIAGGSLSESKRFFERALELAPSYFENRVQFAHFYTRKAGDQALYDRHMKYVLETPAEVIPDRVPEQELARKKAHRLMGQ